MKNKIAMKLITINTSLLIISLVIFCIVISTIFTNYTYQGIKKQLLIENTITSKFAFSDYVDNQPRIFNILTDSITLIYKNKEDQLILTSNSDEKFKAPNDIMVFGGENISLKKGKVHNIKLDSQSYLYTISIQPNEKDTIKNTENDTITSLDQHNTIVVSLLSTKSINTVIRKFILALVICAIALSILSVLVTFVVSKRITNPILKLSSLAKQYANRNFDKKYIPNTKDELNDLAISINQMAVSLKQHEEQKDKLFRNISHEIKTPLTAIYGYAEGIKTGIFSDTKKPLDTIMSESLRIKKLTENLVFLNKLETSMELFDFQRIDLGKVIEKAIDSIESIAILNDIDIIYQPIELPAISIDEDKIFRALVNLLSNCLKHTDNTIEIATSTSRQNVSITIKDNGAGFNNEAMQNLIKGLTQEKTDGSGIGLFIVNEIIKSHNGTFRITNAKQGGAFFDISLPI